MALHRRKSYDESSLYEYAVGALARKMRSVAELKRLLRQRVNEEAMVEAVIARLKEQKYLNDTAYATAYSTFRKENEKFGRLRVISDLKAKGVHGEVIDKAVDAAYAGSREEELARAYLRRKRMAKPANRKDAARIFRALGRAGFRTSTIVLVLKKWDVDEEFLSAMEQDGGG